MKIYGHLNAAKDRPPINLGELARMKAEGEKIACLTAYDASFAAAEDAAGVDVVLVGDSLGMVVRGGSTTVPVTVDDIVYHCQSVREGLHRTFMIADMPFLSYPNIETATRNAARMMQEGGAQMVKLEGGAQQAEIVEYLASRGVPVCGHLGLKPQLIHKIGGYKVQGRDAAVAQAMRDDARILEEAGADMLLLECVPNALGAEITENAGVPVIGIGAGPDVDGQILVMHDMLGLSTGRLPRFVKDFLVDADERSIVGAFSNYVAAVKDGSYPAPEHCFG